MDIHALGVDFMVTGCLKYLLAEAGVAFLYVRRGLIERTRADDHRMVRTGEPVRVPNR